MVYLRKMAISCAVLFLLMVVAGPAATALSLADNAGSGYDSTSTVIGQPVPREPYMDPYAQEPSEPAEEQQPDIPQEESEEPASEAESSYPEKEHGKGKSNLSPGFLRNLFKKSK
jgi:hypothetical protein